MIKRRRITAHKACMITAFVVSMAFLASYLTYHVQVGSVRFRGVGAVTGVPVYLMLYRLYPSA